MLYAVAALLAASADRLLVRPRGLAHIYMARHEGHSAESMQGEQGPETGGRHSNVDQANVAVRKRCCFFVKLNTGPSDANDSQYIDRSLQMHYVDRTDVAEEMANSKKSQRYWHRLDWHDCFIETPRA